MATEMNSQSREKDFGNGNTHLDGNMSSDDALHRIKTAGSISISPELFEKIYLSPQNAVKGDLRKTFANPTPVALGGFLLALTPLTCDLMGWRGAGTANGAADSGAYFFFGAGLMSLGAIGEFFLGNTFPMVVFFTFGAFWGTFGSLFATGFGVAAAYTSAGVPVEMNGENSPEFAAAIGFFLLWMGFLCFVYLIIALRTNLIFVGIFFTLVFAFPFLAATFWYAENGDMVASARYKIAGGAFAFVTCVLGWYIFFAILLAAVDFPIQIPVGDLSRMIKGASDKSKV